MYCRRLISRLVVALLLSPLVVVASCKETSDPSETANPSAEGSPDPNGEATSGTTEEAPTPTDEVPTADTSEDRQFPFAEGEPPDTIEPQGRVLVLGKGDDLEGRTLDPQGTLFQAIQGCRDGEPPGAETFKIEPVGELVALSRFDPLDDSSKPTDVPLAKWQKILAWGSEGQAGQRGFRVTKVTDDASNQLLEPRELDDLVTCLNKTVDSSVLAERVRGTSIHPRPNIKLPVPLGGGTGVGHTEYVQQATFDTMNTSFDDGKTLHGNPPFIPGQGVPVGIFDTWPSTANAPLDVEPEGSDGSDHYTVTLVDTYTLPPNLNTPASPDVSSHGVFVAGLVHAFAKEAGLHVYRVINDEGSGDTQQLANALADFRTKVGGMGVVNLSLVIDDPAAPYPFVNDCTTRSVTHQAVVNALNLNLLIAQGKIVLAAAGNGSAGTSIAGDVGQTQAPAVDGEVAIAVMAADKNGSRACFSSCGDVGVAGGNLRDGGAVPPFCTDYEPNDRIVSAVWNTSVNPAKYTYARWSGTSFATGIMSGIAAHALSDWNNGRPNACVVPPPLDQLHAKFKAMVLANPQAGTAAGLTWPGVFDVAAIHTQCP